MGVSPRTVQRSLTRLQAGGLLKKMKKRHRKDPVAYDINPLLEKLRPLAEKRIKLISMNDFTDTTDETFLRRQTQKSVHDMFGPIITPVPDL
jgi:DNA-binding HxlR family transcriptional regulator